MDWQLKERLKILYEGDQIDRKIKDAVERAIKTIEKKYRIEVNETNGTMLVTHLAMALMRIKKGEKVEGLSPIALEELKKEKEYENCMYFCTKLEEELGFLIPIGEKGYISLYLCNLINQERGEKE